MNSFSVAKNTAYLTASYIGQKALSFFYFVLVARALGVEDLGKYVFALSFTTMFAVVVDLGLTSALVRETAKFPERAGQYLSAVLGGRVVLGVAVYGAIIALVNVLGYPIVTKQLVYLSGAVMIVDQFTGGIWSLFRGWRNLRYESISLFLQEIIVVVAGVLVLYLRLPLPLLIIPLLFGSVFGLIFALVNMRRALDVRLTLRWDWRTIKLLLKISLPLALIAIFGRLSVNVDTVMLSKLAGDVAVGLYNTALKIPYALQFIAAALAASAYPAFSHHFHNNKEQLRMTFNKTMRFLLIAVMPMAFGVATLSGPFVRLVFGTEYVAATVPLQISMLGLLFLFLNYPLGALLNGCDRQKVNAWLTGGALAFNIVANIILIPRFSFVGASIAFVLTHGVLFVASLIVARPVVAYARRELLLNFLKTFFSAAIMSVVLFLLIDRVNVVVLIPLGALIYFAVIFLIRGMTWNDVKPFSDALRNRLVSD